MSSFPEKVQADALVACNRCCCICHKFCGTKIALHHIKQKTYGGDDSFDNCIPLCLDCHEDMGRADPHHVTGKHYTEKELRMHRDKWYKQCNPKNEPEREVVELSDRVKLLKEKSGCTPRFFFGEEEPKEWKDGDIWLKPVD